MHENPLVSIVINNHNYGRFLKVAIESALLQTYPDTEVIVVDDGSKDNSRTIIADYGSRIIPVLKANGGQGSAFNSGFVRSTGDVILFLDSDDVLLSTAVESVVGYFNDPEVVKVHWPLWVIDEQGRKTGQLRPKSPLSHGDLREVAFRLGPTTQISAPTSGNAWSRRFLDRVLPVPEQVYRISADKYLMELAPFFGLVKRIKVPQSLYRLHGYNSQLVIPLEDRLRNELKYYDNYSQFLRHYCKSIGITADIEAWKKNSWWHRQELSIQEISALPHAGDPFILVDDGSWGGGPIAGRRPIPFLEREGRYMGLPPDDDTAIRELERLRETGVRLLVFTWSSFWWLNHYIGLKKYLGSRFSLVFESDQLIAFDLSSASADGIQIQTRR